jgi:hypothetical protein
MADRSWLEIIKENPIGNGLDAFRSNCKDQSTLDELGHDGNSPSFVAILF